MAAKKNDTGKSKSRRPALSPEAQEGKMVALAVDLVEERLRNGSATSQETTHFLKLGSSRERLEQQKLQYEAALAQAKIDAMESVQRQEEMYAEALKAMKIYSGQPMEEDYPELEEYYED